ncbi:toll-like receptor 4 [Liolophura sinensis]|uniref:toll-like receptor 4 n=1 Tax=Liolophura sinensis TaxID=3198878 RepID=UPI0031591D4F
MYQYRRDSGGTPSRPSQASSDASTIQALSTQQQDSFVSSEHKKDRLRTSSTQSPSRSASGRTEKCEIFRKSGKLIADCSRRNLVVVPWNLPREITDLKLTDNKLTNLSAGNFSRYHHLRSLDLRYNSITLLFANMFKGLPELKSLCLKGNNIDVRSCPHLCSDKPFQHVPHIVSLNIKLRAHSQPYTSLDGCLENLTKLESLHMTIKDGFILGPSFRNLTKLVNLDFSWSTKLRVIKEDFFAALQSLTVRELNLAHCNLSYIHPKAFGVLQQLKVLNLNGNINFGLTRACQSLSGLRGSKLQELFISSIVNIQLHDSIIVSASTFKNLQHINLTVLHIDWNSIVKIEEAALNYLPRSLRRWTLRKNKISEPSSFLKPLLRLTELEHLDAKDQSAYFPRNGDYSNPAVMPKNKSVTIRIPPKLKFVRFSFGKSFPFPAKRVNFLNSSLKELHLDNNNLRSFSVFISGLERVEILNLGYNGMVPIPGVFDEFTGLKHLELYNNYFGVTLKNDLKGEFFRKLRNLEVLGLRNNGIYNLAINTFQNNYKLKQIILKENKLSKFHCRIGHLKNLNQLDLRKNSLPYLDRYTSEDLQTIARHHKIKILLETNPFICSCESLTFLKWTISTPVNISLVDIDRSTCLYHNRTTRLSFRQRQRIVRELEILCASYSGLITVVSLFILASVLIVAVGLVYRYRWKLRYIYHNRLLTTFLRRRPQERHGYIPLSGNDAEERWDLMVAYADEERWFVTSNMLPVLEGEHGLKVYIRDRDSIAGLEIATNITRAVNMSTLTLLMLTRHFLQNKWCNYEFQMSRMEGIVRRQNVMIFVVCEDIPTAEMSVDVLRAMKTGQTIDLPGQTDSQKDMEAFWCMLLQQTQRH